MTNEYKRLGDIENKNNDLDKAEEYDKMHLEFCEEPVKESSTRENRRNLANAYFVVGPITLKNNAPDKAEKLKRKFIELIEKNVGRGNT